MSENPAATPAQAPEQAPELGAETQPVRGQANTPEEIAELIVEFEQYRDRLVNETINAAKKAKLPKSAVMSQLEPELAQIDGILMGLREQHLALTQA